MMVASVLKGLVVLATLLPVNHPTPSDVPFAADGTATLAAGQAILPEIASQATAAADQFAGRLRPESRLRKLHLVRPDLIPYPIMYDVYC